MVHGSLRLLAVALASRLQVEVCAAGCTVLSVGLHCEQGYESPSSFGHVLECSCPCGQDTRAPENVAKGPSALWTTRGLVRPALNDLTAA